MADIGVKTSLEGENVQSASDFQIILTSKYPMLKIHSAGYLTFNPVAPSATSTQTVAHDLGYRPAHLVIAEQANDQTFWHLTPFTADLVRFTSRVDNNTLYIDEYNGGGGNSPTLKVYYTIFIDSSN